MEVDAHLLGIHVGLVRLSAGERHGLRRIFGEIMVSVRLEQQLTVIGLCCVELAPEAQAGLPHVGLVGPPEHGLVRHLLHDAEIRIGIDDDGGMESVGARAVGADPHLRRGDGVQPDGIEGARSGEEEAAVHRIACAGVHLEAPAGEFRIRLIRQVGQLHPRADAPGDRRGRIAVLSAEADGAGIVLERLVIGEEPEAAVGEAGVVPQGCVPVDNGLNMIGKAEAFVGLEFKIAAVALAGFIMVRGAHHGALRVIFVDFAPIERRLRESVGSRIRFKVRRFSGHRRGQEQGQGVQRLLRRMEIPVIVADLDDIVRVVFRALVIQRHECLSAVDRADGVGIGKGAILHLKLEYDVILPAVLKGAGHQLIVLIDRFVVFQAARHQGQIHRIGDDNAGFAHVLHAQADLRLGHIGHADALDVGIVFVLRELEVIQLVLVGCLIDVVENQADLLPGVSRQIEAVGLPAFIRIGHHLFEAQVRHVLHALRELRIVGVDDIKVGPAVWRPILRLDHPGVEGQLVFKVQGQLDGRRDQIVVRGRGRNVFSERPR